MWVGTEGSTYIGREFIEFLREASRPSLRVENIYFYSINSINASIGRQHPVRASKVTNKRIFGGGAAWSTPRTERRVCKKVIKKK